MRHLIVALIGLVLLAVAACTAQVDLKAENTLLLCEDALERHAAVEADVRRFGDIERLLTLQDQAEADVSTYCLEAAGIPTATPTATPKPDTAAQRRVDALNATRTPEAAPQ